RDTSRASTATESLICALAAAHNIKTIPNARRKLFLITTSSEMNGKFAPRVYATPNQGQCGTEPALSVVERVLGCAVCHPERRFCAKNPYSSANQLDVASLSP